MLDYQLSKEELQLIEQTGLVATERFMLRITLSVWRILLHIADRYQSSVENLTAEQIVGWMLGDREIRCTQGEDQAYLKWSNNLPDLEFPDTQNDLVSGTNLTSHEKFLTRMLISGISFLKTVAEKCQVPIQALQPADIVHFVEKDRASLQWQT